MSGHVNNVAGPVLSTMLRRAIASRLPLVAARRALALRLPTARHLATASASGVSSSPAPGGSERHAGGVVAKLEEMEKAPWAPLLRLAGTFSPSQWQAAAAADMYVELLAQAEQPHFFCAGHAGLERRYYTELQVRGLHCWLAYVRLRDEPKERHHALFVELMEKLWQQAELDLCRDLGYGYIEMTKHLKAAQHGWHGCSRSLDEALASDEPRSQVAAVLARNLYGDESGEPLPDELAAVPSGWLADYLMAQVEQLRSLPAEDVLKGRLTWAPPPPPHTEL